MEGGANPTLAMGDPDVLLVEDDTYWVPAVTPAAAVPNSVHNSLLKVRGTAKLCGV